MTSYTQLPLIVPSKRCRKCGEVKPLTEFWPRPGSRDGVRNDCKACFAEYQRARYVRDKERILAQHGEYRKAHRQENREYSTRWYRENHERALATQHAYAAKPGMREKITARHRSWRQRNPDRFHEGVKRRYARERGAPIRDFTLTQWQELQAYFGNHCAYCLQPMEKPTQDHMTPLAQGGDHTLANIVPSCLRCNQRKHNRGLIALLMKESRDVAGDR